MIEAMLVFCIVGPTPPAGYDAQWADVRLILSVPAQPNLLSGFGEVRDLRPVTAVMWNPAGNEIPMTGAVTSGVSAGGAPVWKVALTGNVWEPRFEGLPVTDPDIYHVVTLNLEVPMHRTGLIGERDDQGSQWGVAYGWNAQWPGVSHPGNDIIHGAPVWSVGCL